MNEETELFLEVCAKHKLMIVSIGERTPLIKSSMTYPFLPDDSVFADPDGSDGLPRIWRVCEDAGVGGRCGNTGQHQLAHGHNLESGVYRRHHREWRRLDP